MNRERKLHLELLRMIAIFLVVYNHTGRNGCYYYFQIHDSSWRLAVIAAAFVMRCAVSVFFMISGALLLGKNETLKELYQKRVFRFFIVLVIASLISYVFDIRQDLSQFNIPYFFYKMFTSEWCYSYWFLYLYLAWLICLPLLRKLAQNMGNRDYLYLLVIIVLVRVMTFIPLAWMGEPTSYTGSFAPFVLERTIFFPLMGYYFEERVPERFFCKKNSMLFIVAMLVATLITVSAQDYWLDKYMNWEGNGGEGYFSTLGFVPALLLYSFTKKMFLHHLPGSFCQKTIRLFGSCSFGLYLFQHIYLEITSDVFFRNTFGTYFGTVIWAFSICLIGTMATYVIKQIPGVNKYL